MSLYSKILIVLLACLIKVLPIVKLSKLIVMFGYDPTNKNLFTKFPTK